MSQSEHNVRGVKRRRLDDEVDKEAVFRRKLYHDIREVRKTVKKSKTFELQKILKKLKDARRRDSENEVSKDLEAQVDSLKHLNFAQLANSALMTKLKKDKVLHKDPFIQAILMELAGDSAVPVAPGTPMAKVQSRILSSKILALEVSSIVEALSHLLHPAMRLENREGNNNSRASPPVSKKATTGASLRKDGPPLIDDSAEFSGEGNGERSEGSDEGDDDDRGEGAIDGWESGTVSTRSTPVASPTRLVVGSISGEEEFDPDDNIDDGFHLNGPISKKALPLPSNGRSEFLPSLSVGFARGDSDSEFSDSEAKVVDGVRRNRRGQRARRAIWEKKFGKNANHVKKQREIAVRGPKRVPKPYSVSIHKRSNKGKLSYHTPSQSRQASPHDRVHKEQDRVLGSSWTNGSSWQARRNGDSRGKRDEIPLHPSWEAKKKQKSASIVPSQGTKIVFS